MWMNFFRDPRLKKRKRLEGIAPSFVDNVGGQRVAFGGGTDTSSVNSLPTCLTGSRITQGRSIFMRRSLDLIN